MVCIVAWFCGALLESFILSISGCFCWFSCVCGALCGALCVCVWPVLSLWPVCVCVACLWLCLCVWLACGLWLSLWLSLWLAHGTDTSRRACLCGVVILTTCTTQHPAPKITTDTAHACPRSHVAHCPRLPTPAPTPHMRPRTRPHARTPARPHAPTRARTHAPAPVPTHMRPRRAHVAPTRTHTRTRTRAHGHPYGGDAPARGRTPHFAYATQI